MSFSLFEDQIVLYSWLFVQLSIILTHFFFFFFRVCALLSLYDTFSLLPSHFLKYGEVIRSTSCVFCLFLFLSFSNGQI